MTVNFGTQAPIAIGDYLGTPKGLNKNSPGFQPGVKKEKTSLFWRDFCPKRAKIVTKHKI